MKEMKTLEQILETEKSTRNEMGIFGIDACKESILFTKEYFGHSFYVQLELYVNRANNDLFFNKAMVLACWELINR